ncbi:protein ImuB [Yoonia maritima]|uniref:DNA-directed DNA polymerase n=1 Tax=Yoonia maritima TaxID=1435347 RepID=A0A2T0VTK4_9RHOB|nr:DNA polymerase Y family protein [Yoonia maritima]PRY74524.1 protein ImuB [Yoonia maritima]
MQKRVVSLWFEKLPSERVLRAHPTDAPFALTHHQKNTDRIYCLNTEAEKAGLHRGMGFSDARAFCRDLQSRPADLNADERFLHMLARWSKRYCPWVGLEGRDGLSLNITGSAHLFGGEGPLLDDMRLRLTRSGISARIGLADTRGAAWGMAHYGAGGVCTQPRLASLPIAALRLDEKACVGLQRLGVRSIADLVALPRATVTRRFGRDVLLRLDQMMGDQPEDISPLPDAPHYGVQMTLPEPIGLKEDVMAGAERLLGRLCAKLKANEKGARILQLTLRRVDQGSQQVELRLAQPLHDAARILPLFERGVDTVDAGFGIDQLRLVATQIETCQAKQISHSRGRETDRLDDLITRIGVRIGLENVQRFLPADSHIPERSFIISPAAYSAPTSSWATPQPRPICIFPPEPITAHGPRPPARFKWRRMPLTTGRATGPERIAPEWWLSDDNWRSGIRDYWKIDTREGRRLWLFYTPQSPNWYVQGIFA